jgi:uncharacterized protein YciI
MQFIYKLTPSRSEMLSVGPTDLESFALAGHFAYLEKLVNAGTVHLAGRTLSEDQHTFGLVIFYAESESAASELMQGDPAVQQGVMNAELFPFRIALCADQDALHD